MIAYINVIPLATAKNYLRIDSGMTDDDALITNMINSSLSFIEKRTCHIFKDKTKVYNSCALTPFVIVYDYPILNAPANTQVRATNSIVPTVNGTVTLNLGYLTLAEIPSELIDAALQIIKVWYYEAEKQENTTLIPLSVLQAIDVNRRFL